MHYGCSNFDTIKSVSSLPKAKMPIFKNHTYFSVTSLVLNDVHVRDNNVINPSHEKSVLVTGKEELNLKTMDVKVMLVRCLF